MGRSNGRGVARGAVAAIAVTGLAAAVTGMAANAHRTSHAAPTLAAQVAGARTVAGGLCGGLPAGPAKEVVSDAARDRLGLNGWADGALGVTRQPDGTYRFNGVAAFDGPDPAHPQRNIVTQGTLDDPVRDGVVTSTQIRGLPTGYIWVGGGPLYRDPATGITLQTLHLERRLGTDEFYSELHLGRFDPATGETTYLGPLVRPDIDLPDATWNADLSMPQLTVVNEDGADYFHLYFPDFRLVNGQQVTTSLSVARAPVRDVVDAAAKGTVTPWHKYTGNGAWDEPALGGSSADILTGGPMAWAPQVRRSPALGGYVLAADISPREMVLSTSADGLNGWSPRVPLLRDPGFYNAYPTLVGTGSDPADLGPEFDLFYLQWPSGDPNWSNARIMRRTISCTQGQPAEKRAFVRYANGPRHVVTTGTPPAGYTREPGNDWYLWSGQVAGTRPLYGCRGGTNDSFVSTDAACDGNQNTIVATEGFIATDPPTGSAYTALYRCHITGLGDHFVSTDPGCEGSSVEQEGLLGYALTGSAAARRH